LAPSKRLRDAFPTSEGNRRDIADSQVSMEKYTGGEANAINTAHNFVVGIATRLIEILRQHFKEEDRKNA
jgi:hypothetical protein